MLNRMAILFLLIGTSFAQERNYVTFKEYVDIKYGALEKRLDEQAVFNKTALRLQAKEYERRLAELNHEADQLKAMQSTYYPRENAEIERKIVEKEIKALNQSRAYLEGKASMNSVYLSYGMAFVAIILSILGAVRRNK